MKKVLFSVIFFSFFVSLCAQSEEPVTCSTCEYGFKRLGSKPMIGGTMKVPYYGKTKKVTTAAFEATPGPEDTTEMTIGDKYLIDSVALFWNYGPDGWAYLIELPASLKIFEEKGAKYVFKCGNLLVLEAYFQSKSAPTPLDDKPYSGGTIKHEHSGHITHSWEDEPEEEVFEPALQLCSYCKRYECICGGTEYRGTTKVLPNSYVLHSEIDHLEQKDERYYRWNGQDWVYDPIPSDCRRLGCTRYSHRCGGGHHGGGYGSGYQSGQYYNGGGCHYARRNGVRVFIHVHVAGAVCIR